ncbi:MAG: CDP-alcohol phosphatidyltransferase family protein, partial [Actinomycetes bacterium]
MATRTNKIAQRNAGYALHVFTASGAVFGMLALQAVIDNKIREALIWLLVCQVLDGIDGPIARKLDVVIHAPWLSGEILDQIVDYFTYVVVPVAFLMHLNMVPQQYETFVAG